MRYSRNHPQIIERTRAFETQWFSVEQKLIAGDESPYYSLQMADYVGVFTTSVNGNVILVRQFRPAVEQFTIELPAGTVDDGESPVEAARRELLEETGYEADHMEMLGDLTPDSGRLSNRQWCCFAADARRVSEVTEDGIEVFEMTPNQFVNAIRTGEFQHALQLAIVMMAVAQGHWQLPKT